MSYLKVNCLSLMLGVSLGSLLSRAQIAGCPPITAFSASEIGTEAVTFCAAQDATGTLYFGGNSLLSYDGERWTTSPIDGTYGLRSLEFGPDGRLWVAAMGEIGWFEQTPEQAWRFRSLRALLPAGTNNLGEVWKVFAFEKGAIFVSGDQILHWDGEAFKVRSMPGTRRLSSMRFQGTVYVHYSPEGLYALDATGPRLVIPRAILGDAAVFSIESIADGWQLATSQGIFQYAHGNLERCAPEVSAILHRERITSAVRLRDGRTAFGTMTGGIVLMLPNSDLERVLSEKDGLPTSYIRALFVDRDGALWAMTPSHIICLDVVSSSSIFDERAGLPPRAYRVIARSRAQLSVASDNGLYELGPDAHRFALSPFVREYVYDIRPSPDGLLVALRNGLKELGRESAVPKYTTKYDVLAISRSHDGLNRTLLGENLSVVVVEPDGASRIVVKDLPDFARSMVEDSAGNLWIGTMARGIQLARLNLNAPVSVEPIPPSYGYSAVNGRAIVSAGTNGTILLFDDRGAWFKLKDEAGYRQIKHFPARGTAAVSDMAVDGTNWVVHPASHGSPPSVGRIAIRDRTAIWEAHSVAGMIAIGTPRSIWVDHGEQSTLWIGGTKGILRHVVASGPSAPKPRPPLLRVLAQGSAEATPKPVAGPLPYNTALVEFELAAPQFLERPALRIETRIDGVDSAWVAAGPDSRRKLTAPRDGHYRLHARTIADTGVASDSISFEFTLRPPWWRTTTFVLFSILALVPFTYGLYFFRVRALRRRNVDLECKVLQRTKELEAASAAKTQFVANMSHDIRNPLNGIVGMMHALENSRLDGHQRTAVSTLRECTSYLSSLVDDVLDFASIESGRIELHPVSFSPTDMLHSIAEMMKSDTADSDAVLSIVVDPDLPSHFFGDAGRIQQVLVNYVSNALKYAGGQIQLSAGWSVNAPAEVEFSVTDRGSGIDSAQRATLFTKFSRLKQTRNGKAIPGTGLGLTVCRALADRMGGVADVESEVGHGARFFLRLPLPIASAPVAPPPQIHPNTSVLLVEDTDYNAWAASAVLNRLGLACDRARTGEEALRMFGEKRFNVVLLDRNLPDLDGTEVARRMREMEPHGRQAVLLAVTAYCTAEDRDLCLQSGMDDFLGKPLTPEKLRRVLANAGPRFLTAASVHVPTTEAKPGPDLNLLTYLSDGTPGGLDAQIRRYCDNLHEAEAKISSAIQALDFPVISATAHELHGQAKMVGGGVLADAVSHLELAARSRDGATCSAWLPRVSAEIAVLTEAMRRHRTAATAA